MTKTNSVVEFKRLMESVTGCCNGYTQDPEESGSEQIKSMCDFVIASSVSENEKRDAEMLKGMIKT